MGADQTPWVERYRPKTIGDVAHQDEVVAALKQALADGAQNLPHLLFYGPPGTGKTSVALALVRQLFPSEIYRQRVLELNASNERGIHVVRDKIKVFAHGVPPYKVIILDEADAVTGEAQTALRRTMEAYSRITRFILICNYVTRIISPLASRCAKFRFKPLPEDTAMDRLRSVAQREGVSADEDALGELVRASEGDLRKAITTLQSASHAVSKGDKVTTKVVAEVSCGVPPSVVRRFYDAMGPKSSFENVRAVVEDVIRGGQPADYLLRDLGDLIVAEGDDDFTELQKAALLRKLADAEISLSNGASERLQLLDVGTRGLNIAKERTNVQPLLTEP